MTTMHDDVYIISINDGEEEQNIFSKSDAEKLYNDLIVDPDDTYKNIKLIKYNFETKEEVILDEHSFSDDLSRVLENAGYELVETTDSLPVVETEPNPVEVNYSNYTIMVYTAQVIANDMKYLHWNCCGPKFDIIHGITEEYYNKLSSDVDILAELALEQPGVTLTNPSNMASKINWHAEDDKNKFSDREVFDRIQNLLTIYIDALQHNYDTFDTNIQSELDTMIRFWTKELKYKTIRRLETETNG